MSNEGIILVDGVPEVHSAAELAAMRAVNPALEILCGGHDPDGRPCMCPVHPCRRGNTTYLSGRYHISGCNFNCPRSAKNAVRENTLGANTSADELINRYARRIYHDDKSISTRTVKKGKTIDADSSEAAVVLDNSIDLLDITSSVKNPRNTQELASLLLKLDPSAYYGDFPPRRVRETLIRSATLSEICLSEEMGHPVILAASLSTDKVRFSPIKRKIIIRLSAAPDVRFVIDLRDVPNLFALYRDYYREFFDKKFLSRRSVGTDTLLCISGSYVPDTAGGKSIYKVKISNKSVLCWLTTY